LRYLVGVLDREIGYTGLATSAGDYAQAMRQKLMDIHARGWEEAS
jgi:hypothetical protein